MIKVGIISIIFSLCLLNTAICWWELGHMIVAQIAQKRLIELNQTNALNKFNDLVNAFNDFTDGRSNTFVQASVWADDIKEYNATFFDNYHFTNIVYDPNYIYATMTDLQKDVNAVNIVGWCMTVLKANKLQTSFQRAFMARYLLHLVGDIHQPLHSTNMFNATLKTGDLGGNLIHIKTKDNSSVNLHAFMDSIAGQQKDGERLQRPLTDAGKTRVQTLSDSITQQYPVTNFGDLVKLTSSHTWATESFDSAVKLIYPFVFKTNQATQEWTTTMSNLCRERIALGGYRLANMIATIYA